MTTNFDPDALPEWLRHIKRRLRRHHDDVAALLALQKPDDALDGGRLQRANEWVAETIIDCINGDKLHAANFLRAADDKTLEQGLRLIAAIKSEYTLKLGAQKRDAKDIRYMPSTVLTSQCGPIGRRPRSSVTHV